MSFYNDTAVYSTTSTTAVQVASFVLSGLRPADYALKFNFTYDTSVLSESISVTAFMDGITPLLSKTLINFNVDATKQFQFYAPYAYDGNDHTITLFYESSSSSSSAIISNITIFGMVYD